MSIASEITRLQNAKASLKTSINAKSSTQITNETLEDYASFVDNIPSGGSSHDWTAIGYSEEPQSVGDDYAYAKQIYDNWDPTTTSGYNLFMYDYQLRYFPLVDTSNLTTTRAMFSNCSSLKEIPLIDTAKVQNAYEMFSNCRALTTVAPLNTSKIEVMQSMFFNCSNLINAPSFDTSKATNIQSMFRGCTNLKNVPQYNTSRVTQFNLMFNSCKKLTDTSLDNILKMCIGATSYNSTKTLATLGFSSTDYPASRIQALPSYQDFIDAGWTIGY